MAQATQQYPRTAEELALVVYACLRDEHHRAAHAAFDRALPAHQQGYRTVHELDYVDFGLTVGLAFGIARGEDPYEPYESVVERWTATEAVLLDPSLDRREPIVDLETAYRDAARGEGF